LQEAAKAQNIASHGTLSAVEGCAFSFFPIQRGTAMTEQMGSNAWENRKAGTESARIGRFDNAGSNPDQGARRTGGSANDPDGGHELMNDEWRGPDPDPIHEMVPGGQGAEAPPYTAAELAAKMADIARRQPGYGPGEMSMPTLGRGNPEIGSDPSELAPSSDPTSPESRRREGIHESGGQMMASAATDDPGGHGRNRPTEPGVTLAYTGAQQPNLPAGNAAEPPLPAHIQGAGTLDGPIEQRDNSLVFDSRTGNFQVKDEEQGTGVSSQDRRP
jgi:hypothetical protein